MSASVIGVFATVFTQYLWPLLYTIIGVFVGFYLNRVIDVERELSSKLLRPLFEETGQVINDGWQTPLVSLRDRNGAHESVLLETEPIDALQLNPELYSVVTNYLEVLYKLERLNVQHFPVAEILAKAGYDEHLRFGLPDGIIAEGKRGVDPTNRPQFPGPDIVVGEYTTSDGRSDYFDSGYRAPVTTIRRLPLLAFLLENLEPLQTVSTPAGLRSLCRQSSEIDVDYLDSKHSQWAEELWTVLNEPFESDSSIGEGLNIDSSAGVSDGQEPDPMISGNSFVDLVRSSEMAVRLQQIQVRQDVCEVAEKLHGRLAHRLGMRLYNPRRLRLAMRSSIRDDEPDFDQPRLGDVASIPDESNLNTGEVR